MTAHCRWCRAELPELPRMLTHVTLARMGWYQRQARRLAWVKTIALLAAHQSAECTTRFGSETLDTTQAALRFDVSLSTVSRWCRERQLTAIKTTRGWRIPVSTLPPMKEKQCRA